MIQQIDGMKRYEIGRMKKDSLDQPETGEYLYTPVVLTGDQLHKIGIMSWNEFFEGAPPNFQVGRLYHVFESRSQGERKLVAMGTITALRNPNAPQVVQQGLSDNDGKIWNLTSLKESPHNIKFFKDQLNEKDAEIKRLNLKIEEMTKELIKSKEDKVFAEQELRRTIGLNDAINAKEEEYIKAMEKAQKDQQDSSNRILENLMLIAQQGMQLWLASKGNNTHNQQQAIQSPVPVGDPLTTKNDGDIVPIKNKNGDIENWTVKTMGDKKVIVSPDGKMKTFA